jgi:hypothetical protein
MLSPMIGMEVCASGAGSKFGAKQYAANPYGRRDSQFAAQVTPQQVAVEQGNGMGPVVGV